MLSWIQSHAQGLLWTAIASGIVLLFGTLTVAIVIVRLPADYLQRQAGPRRSRNGSKHSAAFKIVRNVAGWLLVVAGGAMLILPGPGFLVVLIGVMLADFPGKRRVQRWILSRQGVLSTANWLRQQFGKRRLKTSGISDRASAPASQSQ
ncbi:MAG: PGPGW domain-containing protein [Phycisphaerales bacterium]